MCLSLVNLSSVEPIKMPEPLTGQAICLFGVGFLPSPSISDTLVNRFISYGYSIIY